MHTGLSEILNHSKRSSQHLGAYMYTKLQTRWHIHCGYRWLKSLPHNSLHIHCS